MRGIHPLQSRIGPVAFGQRLVALHHWRGRVTVAVAIARLYYRSLRMHCGQKLGAT